MATALKAGQQQAGQARAASNLEYQIHWDKMYHKDELEVREWHATPAQLLAPLRPYLEHLKNSGSSNGTLVDCGCGTSTTAFALVSAGGLRHVVLLDASQTALEHVLHRQQAEKEANRTGQPAPAQQEGQQEAVLSSQSTDAPSQPCAAHESTTATDTAQGQGSSKAEEPVVELMLGDVRHTALQDACAAVVLDKGTLDALWSDEDKHAMLRECARLLQPPHGLLASVSFASPARLKLLHAGCPPLGLQWRVHVLGDGDPARGHEVRFLTLMSRDFGPVPYSPDQLTTTLLARLERTGSLLRMDDEEGSVLPCLSDLFEGSQDEEGLA